MKVEDGRGKVFEYCSLCGRFMKRIAEGVGLPLLTGFPPDRERTASTFPYALFVCYNHPLKDMPSIGYVEYRQVNFTGKI